MKRLAVCCLIALLALASLPAHAQEDESQALYERVMAAFEAFDATYSSYYAHQLTESGGTTVSTFNGATTESIGNIITETENYVITDDEDSRNILSYATLSVTTEIGGAAPLTSGSVMEAELRFVDGTLYVNAVYAESDATSLPLPEGWTVVADPNDPTIVALGGLGLKQYLEGDGAGIVTIQKVLGLFDGLATSASIEDGMLEDGTAVEIITLVYGPDAYGLLMKENTGMDESNPTVKMLLENISGDVFTVRVALDADEVIRQVETITVLNMVEVDMANYIEGFTEGSFMTQENTTTSIMTLGELNGEFEPATVPE